MATMAMEREPEVAGFMEHYKYDAQQSEAYRKYGGGTSLPLNSDGLEERKQRLRDERHKDWLKQQEKGEGLPIPRNPYKHPGLTPGPQKPSDYETEIQKMTNRFNNQYNDVLYKADDEQPKYYRVGTPDAGLPGLGRYEEQRKQYDRMRQNDYLAFREKQKKLEGDRMEARRRISPPRQRAQAGIDYNQVQEQSRAMDKKAYQDYMGKFQYPVGAQAKPAMNYEQNRRVLAQERKEEYNRFIEEKQKQERELALRGRPITPPGGLDIGQYDRRLKEEGPQKKKEYKAMLDQQKDEQLRLRAWERIVDITPAHVKVRDDERPLVGSPRDINVSLQERENKDKFRRDLKQAAGNSSNGHTSHHNSPTPFDGGDPNYRKYIELERDKQAQKRRYRDELLQQKQEHMYLLARQEHEVPVIERSSGRPPVQSPSHLASKPPTGPGHRPREEYGSRQTPAYWNEGRRSKGPDSYNSEGSRQYPINDPFSDIPLAFRTNAEENPSLAELHNYGQPPFPGEGTAGNPSEKAVQQKLDKRPNASPTRPQPSPRRPRESPRRPRESPARPRPDTNQSRAVPDEPVMNGDVPLAFQTDSNPPPHRNALSPRQRRAPTPPWLESNSQGQGQGHYHSSQPLPGAGFGQGPAVEPFDDSWIKERRRVAGMERKEDYNVYVKNKMDHERRKHDEIRQNAESTKPMPVVKNAYYGSDEHEAYVQKQKKEMGQEYLDYLNKQYQPPPGRVGLPLGQYQYEPKRLAMEAERNKEYNEIQQKYEPPASAVGLPLGQYKYEPKRLALEKQRNKEYNEILQNASPRQLQKEMEGPQGLDIDVNYDKRKKAWLKQERNKDYNKYLDEENINTEWNNENNEAFTKLHYPHEPANARSRPPSSVKQPEFSQQQQSHTQARPYDNHLRDGQLYIDPRYERRDGFGQQGAYIKAVSAPPPMFTPELPPLPPIHYNPYERRTGSGYGQRDGKRNDPKRHGIRPDATATTLPVGQYDDLRPEFEAERNREYNRLKHEWNKKGYSTRSKAQTPPQGLPIGQHNYEPMYKAMERQRNEEYNHFLHQKYGATTHRSFLSEPDRSKASFYFGNDMEHDMRKKHLDEERHREYNSMMKEKDPPRSRSIELPKDSDSGLPIGQQHHDAWRKFLRDQRNREYNQMMDLRNNQGQNRRGWNYNQSGILELRGDDAIQSKQRELRAERQKEYNERLNQLQEPPNHKWPEPEDRGALLVKKGVYDHVRQMYDDQRKKEFMDNMSKHREEIASLPKSPHYAIGNTKRAIRSEPADTRYWNPMVQNMGRYEDVRKQLTEVRKQEFQNFMQKYKDEMTNKRPYSETIISAKDEINPLVKSMGNYEHEVKQKMILERRKEFQEFDKQQKQHLGPKGDIKELTMPHVASAETPLVNYMGKYDEEKVKFIHERQKDQSEYTEKRKHELRSPRRNFVYPTVAVAEKPLVDHMGHDVEKRQRDLKQELKRDLEVYQSEQRAQEPRRHEYMDTSKSPYEGGIFNNLGEHGGSKDKLMEQRRQEYNEHIQHNQRPTGRPNWVKEPLPNDPHGSRRHEPAGADRQYEAMLEEKRREESLRRRYDPDMSYPRNDEGAGRERQYRPGY